MMQRSGGSMGFRKHRQGQFGKNNFNPDRGALMQRQHQAESDERDRRARRSVGVEWFDSIVAALTAVRPPRRGS